MLPLLADQDAAAAGVDVIIGLAWLSGAAILLAVAFLIVRRIMMRDDDDRAVETGFTLSDLRRLHAEGELTDAQFASAKAALIARGRAAMGGLGDDADRVAGDEHDGPGLSDGDVNEDEDNSSDKTEGEDGADRPPHDA